MRKGVDVSVHNGTIDWAKVKKAGIEFAIIRSGYGWDRPDQVDKCLAANVAGCEKNDIPYGFYHYSYATTPEEAKQEAKWFLSVVKGYRPSMPLVFDWEEASILDQTSAAQATAIAEAFLTTLEEAGYYGMIYGSSSKLNQLFNNETMRKYDVWVAHWGVSSPTVKLPYGMWQYSATGKVDGISTVVDMNYAYKEYPDIIKGKGMNGWASSGSTQPPEQPDQEVVPKQEHDALKAKYNSLVKELDGIVKRYKEE